MKQRTVIVTLEIPTVLSAKAALKKAVRDAGAVQGAVMVVDATKGKAKR